MTLSKRDFLQVLSAASVAGMGLARYADADAATAFYRFTASSSGSARVNLSNFQVSKGQLMVYTGSCSNPTRIGHNGDTDVAPAREITLSGLTAGNTYYIWVLSAQGLNPASPYTLRVEMAGP